MDRNLVELRLKKAEQKRLIKQIVNYTLLITVSFIMIYPLIWLLGASFDLSKSASPFIIPRKFTFDGWKVIFSLENSEILKYDVSLFRAFLNTMQYAIPQTLFMTTTTLITAFVVTRMKFKGRKLVYTLIIMTLLMPNTVFTIPMFTFWNSNFLQPIWRNSTAPFLPFLPLWSGALFAVNSFSVFMYIQVFRTIPKDLDESAYIDGANKFQLIWYILVPIIKSTVITVALLLFLAAFNDYQRPLIYNTSMKDYTISLVLAELKGDSVIQNFEIYAKSVLIIGFLVVVFFVSQKYFLGSDTDAAVKG